MVGTQYSDIRRPIKASTRRTVSSTRQKLASSTGTAATYDYELLVRYALARRTSIMIVPPIIMALAAILWFFITPSIVAIWGTMVVVSQICLTLMVMRFLRVSKSEFKVKQ